MTFEDAVRGLIAGDFSRLEPLFQTRADGSPSAVVAWFDGGRFVDEPRALAEAFTCACFNGCTDAVAHLLAHGVDPGGGNNTGLNALHWAANRGQLNVVQILIRHEAALETRNSYGGTVLGCTVWSAVHEPRPDHFQIIEALLEAGANVEEAEFPSGDERVDRLLKRHGAAG